MDVRLGRPVIACRRCRSLPSVSPALALAAESGRSDGRSRPAVAGCRRCISFVDPNFLAGCLLASGQLRAAHAHHAVVRYSQLGLTYVALRQLMTVGQNVGGGCAWLAHVTQFLLERSFRLHMTTQSDKREYPDKNRTVAANKDLSSDICQA